jgi:hypothetical protein
LSAALRAIGIDEGCGTVSDHVLNVNGEDVSLRDLCGKNDRRKK